MNSNENTQRLQTQLSPDKHICSRCGYEHNCRQEGCRIIREAIQIIEGLQMRADAAISQLKEYADCDICLHAFSSGDTPCEESDFNCNVCQAKPDCVCKNCDSGSLWEWKYADQ